MGELHKAMAEAFGKIESAVKDKENSHYKSKYADLVSIVNAIKPALSPCGLWFTQVIHNTPGFASVETLIMHSSGESFSGGILSVPVMRNDAHGYCSALTYARRYSLLAIFGVAPEDPLDDDGNKACEEDSISQKTAPKKIEKSEKKPIKLNESELDELAHIVTVKMMSDSSLACLIVEDEMSKFLYDWQEKTPLHPAIDNLMENNRVSLLSAFSRWQKEKKPA